MQQRRAQLKLSQESVLLASRVRVSAHHGSNVIQPERSSRRRIRILHRGKVRRSLRGIAGTLVCFDVFGEPCSPSFGCISNDIRSGIDSRRESVASGRKSQKEILVSALLEPGIEEVVFEHLADNHAAVRNAIDRPATRGASTWLGRIHRVEGTLTHAQPLFGNVP